MKEVHNIHNHKIKTVEGYWVLPGQTIYVDDEGKKCKKPEEQSGNDNDLRERVEELEKKSSNEADKEIVRKVVNSTSKKQFEQVKITTSEGKQVNISGVWDSIVEYKGNLYVGSLSGLFCSSDGINFNLIQTPTEINAACVYKDKLFCGCQKLGIFTYDGSKVSLLSQKLQCINFMCVFRDNLYVGTASGTNGSTLWYSTDGINFTEAKEYKIGRDGKITDELVTFTGPTVRCMIVYKDTLYVGTVQGLACSTDGVIFGRGNLEGDLTDCIGKNVDAFCIYKDILYFGASKYLFEINDGKTITKNATYITGDNVGGIQNMVVYEDKLYIGRQCKTSSLIVTDDGINFTQSDYATSIPVIYILYGYKGHLFCSDNGGKLNILKSIVSDGATGITIEKPEDIDSIVNINLNVDGEMVTPLFSKKQDNDIFIELPASAITSKFPAYKVKATIEYTKS